MTAQIGPYNLLDLVSADLLIWFFSSKSVVIAPIAEQLVQIKFACNISNNLLSCNLLSCRAVRCHVRQSHGNLRKCKSKITFFT